MTERASRLTSGARITSWRADGIHSQPALTMRVFVDALERLGYQVEPLLAIAGLRRSDLADPDARIPSTACSDFFGAAMRERPMKNLGARLAAQTPLGAFPLIDYLVVTSETVGAGLRRLARYLRLTEAPNALRLCPHEEPPRVVFENVPNAFSAEFGVALTMLHLREASDRHLPVLSVHFCHTPDDAAEIEHLLEVPVLCNSYWNGFQLSQDAWEVPLRNRNSALCGILEQHAAGIAARMPESNQLSGEVRRVLIAQLANGTIQMNAVARELAISGRSLQRRLAADGLSFQQLLDSTRRDAAVEYLSNPRLSLGEIAYLLGYSEPAAFHRAFKRWHRITPQAFRRNYSRNSTTVAPAPPSDGVAG